MSSDESVLALWRKKLAKACFWIGALTVAGLLIGGLYGWVRWQDDEPITYADIEAHFKYGSTGGERGYMKQFGFGIPYWIWVSLPELFPEYLPDSTTGYTSFGMIYEPGRDPRFDLPIGMSMRRVMGIDRVYFNCAVCHTGTVRPDPDSEPTIVLGMPANRFDLGQVARFLGESAADWRFRSGRIFPIMDEMVELRDERAAEGETVGVFGDDGYRPDPLNRIDRLVFNYVGIPLMREQLLTLTSRLSFIDLTSWGPGRVDTFNPPKALLGFPMEKAPAREKIGNADLPAVWNQRWKAGMQLHWDGNNTAVDERNLSAGFGTGATPTTLDKELLLRTADWLWEDAQPEPFPEEHIDRTLSTEGEAVYMAECWNCHGYRDVPFKREGDGGLVGTVTPIEDVGTDPWRLNSYTSELASAQGSLYAGFPERGEACPDGPEALEERERCYPARFSHFRKTHGYANMPLDGLWLRAPYLHNGSVPNLRMLLEPPSARPDSFWIAYDVYDYENVGFVTEGPDARSQGWLLDTTRPGNGNQGHLYGTDLAPPQKNALIEYLKTFGGAQP